MAAHHDADKADLTGILTWDLMHLNKHGFNYSPNAGGITGLIDETTFFHPVYNEKNHEGEDLEKTIGRIVANQYVEVRNDVVLLPVRFAPFPPRDERVEKGFSTAGEFLNAC